MHKIVSAMFDTVALFGVRGVTAPLTQYPMHDFITKLRLLTISNLTVAGLPALT